MLSLQEIRQIAKSVSKWTWNKYVPGSGEKLNRGAVSSQVNNWDQLSLLEQQQVAAKTNIKQKAKTLETLTFTLNKLGGTATQKQVSEASGKSLKTVKRYWNLLK